VPYPGLLASNREGSLSVHVLILPQPPQLLQLAFSFIKTYFFPIANHFCQVSAHRIRQIIRPTNY
jgi:hypothetical protein